MATLVNANFWIYFTNTDVDDRVRCKICKKSLKSKRSFNLRKHLKHAHKLEIRHQDKRFSHFSKPAVAKNNPKIVNTLRDANFWSYFSNGNSSDKVACKLCSKELKSNHGFNLRKHLKHVHNIEIRLDNQRLHKTKDQLLNHTNENATVSTKMCENNFLESEHTENNGANTEMFDSHGSCSRIPKNIKEECIQDQDAEKYSIHVMNQQISFKLKESEQDDSEKSTRCNNQFYYNTPNVVEPAGILGENIYYDDPLRSSDPLPNVDKFEPIYKKEALVDGETKDFHLIKNEEFEQWAKRKKQLLEIEELEMRNYKLKLELWEKEKHLNLKCSKFTKDFQICI